PSLPDNKHYPETSEARRQESTAEHSLDQDLHLAEKIFGHDGTKHQETLPSTETVLYLAYGSNMCSSTFNGMRGIKPLSQTNVLVPELRLSFDQPGVPYSEPCFAATQYREVPGEGCEDNDVAEEKISEKAPLMQQGRCQYHKDRWNKPLVGVVYEVTLTDYARMIATEGGGHGYREIVVDCYPFPEPYNAADPVPDQPTTKPFKVHSLLSPAANEAGSRTASHASIAYNKLAGSNFGTSYAQPSARYLNLLITGAAEHNLPISYQTYLSRIRPYRITTTRQRIGKFLFRGFWRPIFLKSLQLSSRYAGEDGRSPPWVLAIAQMVTVAMWGSYDLIFRWIFGDGERTIED
ncbi:hypothetical protein ASPWEDRAFT_98094, partial [Aspergillus wentii DTO 134E9]